MNSTEQKSLLERLQYNRTIAESIMFWMRLVSVMLCCLITFILWRAGMNIIGSFILSMVVILSSRYIGGLTSLALVMRKTGYHPTDLVRLATKPHTMAELGELFTGKNRLLRYESHIDNRFYILSEDIDE